MQKRGSIQTYQYLERRRRQTLKSDSIYYFEIQNGIRRMDLPAETDVYVLEDVTPEKIEEFEAKLYRKMHVRNITRRPLNPTPSPNQSQNTQKQE